MVRIEVNNMRDNKKIEPVVNWIILYNYYVD